MTDDVREFTITFDGVGYRVVADGDKITVNGRPFTVDVEDDDTVLVDGIGYDVVVEGDRAEVGGSAHTFEVAGLSIASGASSGPRSPALLPTVEPGDGAIVAIMPGKVTRVMVEEGHQVQEGNALCVLEAMKMENELRADRDGVVDAVHVSPGDDVEKGQVLVEIS